MIKTAPLAAQVYLGEIDDEVKKLENEADCSPEERAWVKVRQATERDVLEIASFQQSQELIKYQGDDTMERTSPVTFREVHAYEVFLTLTDAGNIVDGNDQPLFRFVDGAAYRKYDGGFQAFKERYGLLPPEVALALQKATYEVNPTWDWLARRQIQCRNCGTKWLPVADDWD